MHWLLHVTGADNVSGAAYGFWSGFGSDIGEITLIGLVVAAFRRHNCHRKGCWRIGKHVVSGTPWCSRHHGDARHPATPEDLLMELLAQVRAADGPVRAGAGRNPAAEGLPAEGPVVPPAAATNRKGM